MSGLSDSFQRPINYLRVSVTDRCNLRCVYCVPSEGFSLLPREQILSYEEIYSVVDVAAELGITRVRLSGGEPLVRAGIVELVRMIAGVEGISDISLTTNGLLLGKYAADLKEAGLNRVNVSLDTMDRERFRCITGVDGLDDVIEGIEAAREVGFAPVKINMVVIGELNQDEVTDFACMARDEGWHVRFIELMPFCENGLRFVPVSEVRGGMGGVGDLEPCSSPVGDGPAKYYRFAGSTGTVGFITPVSEHFCFRCNRIRLTADGRLLPCLVSDDGVDLLPLLRKGASREDVVAMIRKGVGLKPKGHKLWVRGCSQRPMAQIGG